MGAVAWTADAGEMLMSHVLTPPCSPSENTAENDGSPSDTQNTPKKQKAESPPRQPRREVSAIKQFQREAIFDFEDMRAKTRLERMKTSGTDNLCLANSYLQACGEFQGRCAPIVPLCHLSPGATRSHRPCVRVRSDADSDVAKAKALRQELLEELEKELPPTSSEEGTAAEKGWSANMCRSRVRRPLPPSAAVPLTAHARASQARKIVEKNLFMTEAFVHALVNLKKVKIVTFQDATVAKLKCLVPILFEPGYKEQGSIELSSLKELQKDKNTVFIYWDRKVKHYSTLVPYTSELAPSKRSEGKRSSRSAEGASSVRSIDLT